jgi:two-component system response regulator YesN
MYTVLLVDDEELERKILSFTLQNSNLPIKIIGEASNGRECLENVHHLHPDLIIMDIKMPGIDGIEVTRQIKSLYPSMEIIILTAYGKFSYSQQAIRAQATDYLLKPIQPQQLIDAVKLAFSRISGRKFQPLPALDLTGLEEAVKNGNLTEAKHQLVLILDQLTSAKLTPINSMFNSIGLRLMVITEQAILAAGADPDKITSLEIDANQSLSYIVSFQDLTIWAENLLKKCISLLSDSNQSYNQVQILVRKAMDYIESNYAGTVSLKIVASHVHLSPAYLSRLFTEKTGVGFTDYLTQVRLKQAKHQLRCSNQTIDQIAVAAGFSSSSYFSAIFKKHEGITPSEYRLNHAL